MESSNKTGAEATQAHTSVFNALSTDLLTAKSFSGVSTKKKRKKKEKKETILHLI
jgi:hypothetical protein